MEGRIIWLRYSLYAFSGDDKRNRSEVCSVVVWFNQKLAENKEKPISKEEMIELIKLVYEFNPDGKGKQRKSTLQETLDIVNSAL